MKKIIILACSVFTLNSFGQTTFQIKDIDNNVVLTPNQELFVTTDAVTNVKVNFDIKNTSVATQTYSAKRYDMILNAEAAAYFCFAGNCYGSLTFVSPYDLVLNPGQSASDIAGSYNILTADLDEGSIVGPSFVKYTFSNINNPSDSIQVSIKYNINPPVNFLGMSSFSAVTGSSGLVDPTPTPTQTGMSFSPFSALGTSANSAVSGEFAFSGWPVGATDGNDTPASMTGNLNPGIYYSITVTPKLGYYVSLSSINFKVNRSINGIRNFSVRSSQDNHVANIPAVTTNTNLSILPSNVFLWNSDATTGPQGGNSIQLVGANFKNFTNAVSFRFYGWNSEDAAGTFGIDDVTFDGMASMQITGIATVSHDLNSKINLYPNPSADGNITVDATIDYTSIRVINVEGKIVSLHNANELSGKTHLNLSTLAAGIYYVQIYTSNGIGTEKLIITK